jgi:hypothetical protein
MNVVNVIMMSNFELEIFKKSELFSFRDVSKLSLF